MTTQEKEQLEILDQAINVLYKTLHYLTNVERLFPDRYDQVNRVVDSLDKCLTIKEDITHQHILDADDKPPF